MIPCVKIFPTLLNVNNDDESFSNLIRTINLMKYINHDEIYNKNDYIRNIEPITNINCFEVSDDGTFIGIGLEKGEINIILFNSLSIEIQPFKQPKSEFI